MFLRVGDQLVTEKGVLTWTVQEILVNMTTGETFVNLWNPVREGKNPVRLSFGAVHRRLLDGYFRFA